MLDVMYELPSIANLKECIIDEGVIKKNDKPKMIFATAEEQAAAAAFNKKAESA
jgi:ATP-dependent Clp protease ATP-binding subunit ClpX